MTRKLSILATALLMLAVRAVPASASFHFMKIVEVFAGTTADPTAQYVMLQMYFSRQNLVTGRAVTVYDANGTLTGTFTFAGPVASGVNLSTILIATSTATAAFGVAEDLRMDPVLSPAGGAVCWAAGVDCVAWGSFSAPGALPVAPGQPFNAPTGLIPDMAMHRTLSTLLHKYGNVF